MFCLFLHIGRILEKEADILFMPLGLPMLAGVLDDNGFESRIFNAATAGLIGGISIKELIIRYNPRIIAMPIQWHQQLPFVLEKIKDIRKDFPDVLIVSGGFTASYFAKEILSQEHSPDFIIRGDGEIPLLALAKCIIGNGDYSKVPNLAWKKTTDDRTEIIINPLDYVADGDKMSGLNYARYDLVINKEQCMHNVFFADLTRDDYKTLINSPARNVVFYNPGRGCSYMCSYCGGNCKAQRRINGRGGFFFKSIDSALMDIKGFIAQGFDLLHICFDPDPKRGFYFDLFSKLRKDNIDIACVFEPFGCPDFDFLDSFAMTFKKNIDYCRITLSPESFSERIRNTNKNPFYTNVKLLKTVIYARNLGIPVELSFMSSLPGETMEDYYKTLRFAKKCQEIYGCEVDMGAVTLEPASQMYENPYSFGIKTFNNGFESFLEKHDRYYVDWEHQDRKRGNVEILRDMFNSEMEKK